MVWLKSKLNKNEWKTLLIDFNVKSFYNLFEYKHFSKYQDWQNLKINYYQKNQKITSLANLQIKKKFFFKIIYIPGGIEGKINNQILKDLLTYIKKNLGKFSLILIDLNQQNNENINLENWVRIRTRSYDTFIKNLKFEKKEIDKTYSKNFRHNCRRSYKKNQNVHQVEKPNVDEVYALYKEMETYKKIKRQYNKKELKLKINSMSENVAHFELRNLNNELISYRSIVFIKNYAWDYLAATSIEGRKTYASYKIIDQIFKFCIDNKISNYDLSGVDKINNLGVYNFKKGAGGKFYTRIGYLLNSSNIILKFMFLIYLALKSKIQNGK